MQRHSVLFQVEHVDRELDGPLAHLVNLGWEQILNKLDVGMKTPRDDVSRSRVFHICWTREHQDFLAKNGIEPDHLPLTGNPVMKLYDDPYRSYFKSREQLARLYELDGTKKWVLFPESYQFAFFSDEHLKLLVVQQNADADFLSSGKRILRTKSKTAVHLGERIERQ